ncbi:hypothetical protein BSLA_02r3372 [Burkholderia stabilis]|nr:hypothetical protein BSLA_02r3372 [Burkholderia stabilis]
MERIKKATQCENHFALRRSWRETLRAPGTIDQEPVYPPRVKPSPSRQYSVVVPLLVAYTRM